MVIMMKAYDLRPGAPPYFNYPVWWRRLAPGRQPVEKHDDT
jgi:hypothetical protein